MPARKTRPLKSSGADTKERLVALGGALRETRQSRAMTQMDLAAVYPFRGDVDPVTFQSTISRWEAARNRDIGVEQVVALEDVLHMPRGHLLLSGGYVEVGVDVERAIMADRGLKPASRNALVTFYRAALEQDGASRTTKS